MKINHYFYPQPNYLPLRTVIGAVLVQQADKRSFEASAVLTIVYFYIIMIVHKCQQSAAQSCLGKKLSLSEILTDRTFENRHVGCKEQEKINRRRTLCTLRINFFEATQQTACIFSKEILPAKPSLNPYRTYLVQLCKVSLAVIAFGVNVSAQNYMHVVGKGIVNRISA